jgi:dTDP-glucose 4,6-dehydratase
VVTAICNELDRHTPDAKPHTDLITRVTDRPGHDRRYAIDPTRIETELGWSPRHDFSTAIETTVRWYLEHLKWRCDKA